MSLSDDIATQGIVADHEREQNQRQIGDALLKICEHLTCYYGVFKFFSWGPQEQTFRLEETLAHSASRLLLCCAEFAEEYGHQVPPAVSLPIERLIRGLPKIIGQQAERWGWGFISHADASTSVRRHLESHHERKKIPCLRAALTWRLSDGVEVNDIADGLADEARRLRLGPDADLTPERAEQVLWDRYKAWCFDPALGQSVPTATTEETEKLSRYCDELEAYLRQLNPPAGTSSIRHHLAEDSGCPPVEGQVTGPPSAEKPNEFKPGADPRCIKSQNATHDKTGKMRKMTLSEAEIIVRDFLIRNPRATIRQIHLNTKISK